MASPITPAERAKLAGIPYQDTQTIGLTPEGLITGDTPAKFTEDHTVAANTNLPAYTPVGYDANGHLVKAVLAADAANTVKAIGITLFDVVTGATPVAGIPIYRAGVFNPAILNWDASYDTIEKKLEAFRGAPTPTQIVIRSVKGATVTLP